MMLLIDAAVAGCLASSACDRSVDEQIELLRQPLSQRQSSAPVDIRHESLSNALTCISAPYSPPDLQLRQRGVEPTIRARTSGYDIAYFVRVNAEQALSEVPTKTLLPVEKDVCVEGRFFFRLYDCQEPEMRAVKQQTCVTLVKE